MTGSLPGRRIRATRLSSTAATLGAGLAVVHVPYLTAGVLIIVPALISALALTAAWSTRRTRRDAAFAVLKLLVLDTRLPTIAAAAGTAATPVDGP